MESHERRFRARSKTIVKTLRDSFQMISKSNVPNPKKRNNSFLYQIHHEPQSSIGEEVLTTIVDDGRRLAGDEVIAGFIDGTGDGIG